MARHDEYRRSGVDYDVLDEVKREAIALAAATGPLLAAAGGREFARSRGSSAFVFEINGATYAMVVEGLGTKSAIAAEYQAATGVSRFADIAQDAVAAIVNDVISVGALPVVVTAYFATGDAAWYGSRQRALDLLNGWRAACEQAGAVWGGGESPTLPGVVMPEAIELGGSSLGVVPAGSQPVFGDRIAPGDVIVLLASSGLHANGASLARRVAAGLPEGLTTRLRSGRFLGDALLDPSRIYVSFVRELLAAGVVPSFLNGITGHGFLKIMRTDLDVRYEITALPDVPEVLGFLVDQLGMAYAEAYSTVNMGAGYVVITRPDDVGTVLRVARHAGHDALVAGRVAPGRRAVAIEPLGIEYAGGDYQVS
jgi:phosphoribosylformylglycinamidine cyclo-ligase